MENREKKKVFSVFRFTTTILDAFFYKKRPFLLLIRTLLQCVRCAISFFSSFCETEYQVLGVNNHIVGLVHKNHISMKYFVPGPGTPEYKISTSNERV